MTCARLFIDVHIAALSPVIAFVRFSFSFLFVLFAHSSYTENNYQSTHSIRTSSLPRITVRSVHRAQHLELLSFNGFKA
jgi:hypothetical protein